MLHVSERNLEVHREMSQTYSSQDLRNISMLIGHGIVLEHGLTYISG